MAEAQRPKASSAGQPAAELRVWVIAAALALLVVGIAGYSIERAHALDKPDGAGFGVPWDHRTHAGLRQFNCQTCHHESEAGDTRMDRCGTCHRREPARAPGEPRVTRLVVSSSDPIAISALTKAGGAVHRVVRVEPDALMIDVRATTEPEIERAKQWITDQIEATLPRAEKVRVTVVPTQRQAQHQSCLGCHNATSEGPTECAGCHSGVRGTESCGTCHHETLEQLRAGPHELVSCASCHTDLEGNEAPEHGGAHPGPVPSADDRADCLTCHCLSSAGEGCAGEAHPFKRRLIRPDQLPRGEATAEQGHSPDEE